MKNEIISINYRREKIYSVLYTPETGKESYPLLIHINGLPGFSPEEEEKRYGKVFTEKGYAYFTFEHRGVRKSTGIFEYYTAQEIIDVIITQLVHHPAIDPSRIALFGESFGGAMAICHAARDSRIKLLLVRSPVFDTEYVASLPIFDELAQIWKRNGEIRFPKGDLKKIFQIQSRYYNPRTLIKHINIPICIITGDNDPIIPYEKVKELYEKVNNIPKSFQVITGAGHNFIEHNHFRLAADIFSNFLIQYL